MKVTERTEFKDTELYVLAAGGGKYGHVSRLGSEVYVSKKAAETALEAAKKKAAAANYSFGLNYAPMTLDDYIDERVSDANRDGYHDGEASAGCSECR